MAVYHVKPTGTLSSGASTAGDWTDANCYATVQSALNKAWVTGDEVILDDTTHTFASLAAAGQFTAAAGNTVTVRSRSSSAAGCVLVSTDGATPAVKMNHSANAYGYVWQDVTFRKSATHTVSGATLIGCSGATADVTFTRCRFVDTILNYPSANHPSGFIQLSSHAGRTVTFTDCEWTGLTSTIGGGSGLMEVQTGNTCVLTRPNVHDITVNSAHATNPFLGWVQGAGNITVTDAILTDLTMAHVALTDVQCSAFFDCTGMLTVDGITSTRIVHSGGNCGAVVIRARGPYDVRRMRSYDCTSTPAPGINAVGGTFLAVGNAGQGVGHDFYAEGCVTNFGALVYCSQGGGGVFTKLKAVRCTARIEGILYSGGWGDVTWDGFAIIDCDVGGALLQGAYEGYAGALYAHIHTTSSTRNKTTVARNGTVYNCRQAQANGYAGATFRGQHATYSHTVTMENVAIHNPDQAHAIYLDESSSGILNVTIDRCAYNTTQVGTQYTGSGTKTLTNSINTGASDLQLDANGFPAPTSPLRHAGKVTGLFARDVRGVSYHYSAPTIGGYEFGPRDPVPAQARAEAAL